MRSWQLLEALLTLIEHEGDLRFQTDLGLQIKELGARIASGR